MSFFNKFFVQLFSPETESNRPGIIFGKYHGTVKDKEKLIYWQKANEHYKNGDYAGYVENFLQYLRDEKEKNLEYKRQGDEIDFHFYQGSKKISGYLKDGQIHIFSDVAEFTNLEPKLLEFLATKNYELKFSKFEISDNKIRLSSKLVISHSNPLSLYNAMRETAVVSDSVDDVLVYEYPGLKPINIYHIKQLPENELTTKIKYLRKWISSTLKRIETLNSVEFAGGISFLLLDLNYKIFYLLSPEGVLLDEIKRIHKNYFESNKTLLEKNKKAVKMFKNILEQNDEEIASSLYAVKAVFPFVELMPIKKVVKFAEKEINKVHWYRENSYKDIALAICEYIVGYSEYNLGIEPYFEELFKIFWHVLNFDYFQELGFEEKYVLHGKINFLAINQRINKISHEIKKIYPGFNFNTKHLTTLSVFDFATSFIYEFINSGLNE